MNSHKNARLTAKGRAHLIEQIALLGLDEAARHAGISTRRGVPSRRVSYLFESLNGSGFKAELPVDEEGIVLNYSGLFQRVKVA